MNLNFMERAIQLAAENVRCGRGGPFGALVVKGDEIIAEGTNLVTSTNDPTAHAEVVAIRLACQKLNWFCLSGCEIYTSCEPCPMCFGAIYWARPTAVYYSATAEDAAAAGFDDSFICQQFKAPRPQRAIPMSQILSEQAMIPFNAWREQTAKVAY